ncbi:MAG TPA: S41 family peptidase [Myxococcota bacterium]|nr:S41 family peptidase [Myxococcota bacterium]HOH77619.1 S41 family peptidase [Myxococcota bacterium]
MKRIGILTQIIAFFLMAAPAALAAFPTAPAAPTAQLSEPDDSDPEDIDYWKDVPFTDQDFASVRRIVEIQYIDPEYNRKLAWINAADYVLHTLEPPMTLMPRTYFRIHHRDQAETRLNRRDRFVLTEHPKDDKLNFRSMTDDDIRKKKQQFRARAKKREAEWRLIDFSEPDFRRVLDFVLEKSKEKPGFRVDDLYIAATSGYLASLDPHTSIVSAKAWEESTKETEDGSFEGIGAMLTTRQDEIIVETPIEGQPAEKAGVRAGDQIVSVNGRKVTGMSLQRVVKMIKGEKGTTVVLIVRRLGVPQDLEFRIVRQHIEVLNIQAQMLKGHPDIGYMKITGFIDGTARRVQDAISGLIRESRGGRLRGLVIDVRGNSGGLLQESVNIADAFLEDGVIVSVKSPKERDDVYRAKPGSWDFPVVVLANSSSASASEILASAIQENGRGLVIGDRTFGKASVQTLMPAYPRSDYFVKVTIARYYAPSGRTIQVTGVSPDIDAPPQFGKTQPLGFREEDLNHHLTMLDQDHKPANAALVRRLSSCTAKMGTAGPKGLADLYPTIKADNQLATAADYLECMWLDREHNRKLSGGGM